MFYHQWALLVESKQNRENSIFGELEAGDMHENALQSKNYVRLKMGKLIKFYWGKILH